jgi:hypothetical protein
MGFVALFGNLQKYFWKNSKLLILIHFSNGNSTQMKNYTTIRLFETKNNHQQFETNFTHSFNNFMTTAAFSVGFDVFNADPMLIQCWSNAVHIQSLLIQFQR